VYPHILATGGLHDPRVGYWEPAKLVARLREASLPAPPTKSGLAERLLLLKTDMGAGHFSVTGRFERLKEVGLR
jgi:oligopeptidase B